MAKNPRRSSKRGNQVARQLERNRLSSVTGPDQDKPVLRLPETLYPGQKWASQVDAEEHAGGPESLNAAIDAEAADYIGIHANVVVPCEACGNTENTSRRDRYALVKGARVMPVSDLDRDAAEEDKRVARVCWDCISSDPEIKQTLDYIDADDLTKVDAEVLNRVHTKLVHGLTTEGITAFASRKLNAITDGNMSEVERLYQQIGEDLQKLLDRGQLLPEHLERENALRTIAILSKLRMEYGDITAREDLLELFTAVEAESDFCQECNKIYPKGSHRHGMDTQKVTGERVANSAELLTLNNLANFSAFEKTIPFETIRKLDPSGVHLFGFRQHSNMTRGVKGRDFFRCQVLVKIGGRSSPTVTWLDVVPAWFVRLEEADDSVIEKGTPTTMKFDLAPDTFPEAYRSSGVDRLAITRQGPQPYQEIPVSIISDEQMIRELQEADRSELSRIAILRDLSDYRALGKFEAWALLATSPNPEIVKNRFKLALEAVRIAGDRQFTEADVEQAIKEWAVQF